MASRLKTQNGATYHWAHALTNDYFRRFTLFKIKYIVEHEFDNYYPLKMLTNLNTLFTITYHFMFGLRKINCSFQKLIHWLAVDRIKVYQYFKECQYRGYLIKYIKC